MNSIKKKGINLNRKMLSEIAIANMHNFSSIVKDACDLS